LILATSPGRSTDRCSGCISTPPSWSAAEWELTGADITDVLAWADAHTPTGGVAEVSVVVRPDPSAELGKIRLRGHDPNASDPARSEIGGASTLAS